MADDNKKNDSGWPDLHSAQADRELDAALAKYAAVEPRPGLEGRILANLRAEQTQAHAHTWWPWSIPALAAVVMVAMALAWRSRIPSQPVAQQTPVLLQSPQRVPIPPQETAHEKSPRSPAHRRVQSTERNAGHAQVAKANPKLDVFPAPQPLSREEIALARYVRDFPQEAVLIAQSQEETEIEMQRKMEKTEPLGSDQQER